MNWTHVSAGLPPNDTPVLVTDGESVLVGKYEADFFGRPKWCAVGVSGYEWSWDFDDFDSPCPITHWMPLPSLPFTDKETTP